MNQIANSRLSRNKLALILIGIAVVGGAWWAFGSEKLFINEKVNEAAPFTVGSEAQPIYTGKLEGKIHQTSGRATIYKSADGKHYLRLTDFMTANGPDVHVVLVRAEDKALEQEIVKGDLDHVELGSLKGNQGDQNYDLPAAVELNQDQAGASSCERFHPGFCGGRRGAVVS